MDDQATIKGLDASGTRDPNTGRMAGVGLDKMDKAAKEDQKEEKFPVMLPEGLTKSDLIQWAARRKKSFKAYFDREKEKMLTYSKAFQSLPIAGMTGGNYIPLVNSAVETDVAKRMASMFNKSKVVDAIVTYAPGQVLDEENKILIDDLINQEILYSAARTPEKAFDAMKGQSIEGTGIGKCYWEIYECESKQPDFAQGPGGIQIQIGEHIVIQKKGRPNWSVVPVQTMIWDKRLSTRIQDSDYTGQTEMSTMNELLLEQENGNISNVDEIEKLVAAKRADNSDEESKRRRQLNEGSSTESMDSDEGVFEVTEWHAFVPYQETDEETGEKHWTQANLRFRIVNDQVLIKCEENPWGKLKNPYFSYRYSILPRQFLGNSVAQPIMGIQTSVNNLQASSDKLVRKAAKNPTFYERSSGLDGRKIFIDEDSLIPVNDANKVKFFPVDAGAIRAVSEERSFLIELSRDTVAAGEMAQGIGGKDIDTATEANIMNTNSGQRFQSIVDQTGWEFFCGMATNFYFLIKKFAQPGELLVRESSQDGNPRPIMPQDLVNDYIFVPITQASVQNNQAKAQQRMQLIQQLGQFQSTAPQMFMDKNGNQVKFDLVDIFIKEVMPAIGIKNGQTYIMKTSPQELQQQQMQQMAQAQGQTGSKPPSIGAGPAQAGQQSQGAQSFAPTALAGRP